MSMSKIMGCASATNVRQVNDAYDTPSVVVEALVRVEARYCPRVIWEPCSGNGGLAAVLREHGAKVIEQDLDRGHDFLKAKAAKATAIVTNPPYKFATEFILHAAKLGVGYHAWLLKADFLNAQRAIKLISAIGYPTRIWALTERPDFLCQGAPTMNCSWFVWCGPGNFAALKLLSVVN